MDKVPAPTRTTDVGGTKKERTENEGYQRHNTRPSLVVGSALGGLILAGILLWLGEPNDLHVITLRNAFLGAFFVLLLRVVAFLVDSESWHWLAILDWRSPLMAILIQVNLAAPGDALADHWEVSRWASLGIFMLGIFLAGFEAKAKSANSQFLVASVGFLLVLAVAILAGYTDNFYQVNPNPLAWVGLD